MSTETKRLPFETDDDIEIVRLEKWLDYASGYDPTVSVALPLIQRSSVWKPKQIIDLWDTLLRGMPLGSLMYGHMPVDMSAVGLVDKNLIETPKSGTIGLIDGQQRTLSMLIAWTKSGKQMDRRIWVDFADTPTDEYLFRLHVTTKNQPFGFQKSAPFAKLSLGERNDARLKFCNKDKELSQRFLFKKAMPYHSNLPLDLRVLVECWRNLGSVKIAWITEVERMLENLAQVQKDQITESLETHASKVEMKLAQAKKKIPEFADALERLFKLQIPLLKVDPNFFEVRDNDLSDPPLAILFKRIGTGGTDLTNEDYVYSVIKHRLPSAYKLVTDLHKAENINISRLLSATDLVMTAVRLIAAEHKPSMTDWETPTKQNFHSLIKKGNSKEDFLEDSFLKLIKDGGLGAAFLLLSELIGYEETNNPNGLPPHALPLLNRPLVQVLLRWIRTLQLSKPVNLNATLSESRAELLRFVMYWQLCVTDPKKASELAFMQLKEFSIKFPGKAIYQVLLDKKVAIPIISPSTIKEIKEDVAFSTDLTKFDPTRLRGWKRFEVQQTSDDEVRSVISLYQRWWGNGNYVHPILLWLQREYVAKFKSSPIAGRDEDTPYDYDHICPANHWNNWTGSSKAADSLMHFLAEEKNGGHWRTGNSIGNVRIWNSSENRHDGDDAPSIKLKLKDEFKDESKKIELLKYSAICQSQIDGWKNCSREKLDGKDDRRSWNPARVQAFQDVVEQRAFALYISFYKSLSFSEWPEYQPDVKEE
jgi:hypothetical protein